MLNVLAAVLLGVVIYGALRFLADRWEAGVQSLVSAIGVAWHSSRLIVEADWNHQVQEAWNHQVQEAYRELEVEQSGMEIEDAWPEAETLRLAHPRPGSILIPEQVFLVWDQEDGEFKRVEPLRN